MEATIRENNDKHDNHTMIMLCIMTTMPRKHGCHYGMSMIMFRDDHGKIMAWQPCFSKPGTKLLRRNRSFQVNVFLTFTESMCSFRYLNATYRLVLVFSVIDGFISRWHIFYLGKRTSIGDVLYEMRVGGVFRAAYYTKTMDSMKVT